MNRKIAVIIIAVSFILVTLVLVFYLQFKSMFTTVSPVAKVTPTLVVEEMTTWDDPAEFSFQYPKSLALNSHNEDQINFAHVELTSATHAGSLVVWVKDTNEANLESWAKKEKLSGAIDTTLGGEPAKKELINPPSDRLVSKLIVSTLRNGYLYQIDVSLDDADFWNKTFDTVSTTFKFKSPVENVKQKQAPDTSSDQGSTDIGGSADEETVE